MNRVATGRAQRLWLRLPTVVRAIVLGEVVVTFGVLPPGLALLANLRLTPRVPWLLVPVASWLWLYWRWLDGAGPPRSTSSSRRRLLRAPPVARRVWPAALVAGALGLLASLALGGLTVTLAGTSASAFRLGIDFARYPWWTVACCLVSISVTAGVVEEAGFRGYMLTPIQQRHGWAVAALVSGGMFFLDHHLSHAYATLAFLPFFVIISVVHALLVRATGSIRPSVVLHAVFDVAVIPFLYGILTGPWVATLARHALPLELAAIVACTAGSALGFRRLAVLTRRGTSSATAPG